jgi:nicotinamidase-related amidase
MIEFKGRFIPETLEEIVEPRNTALIVVDVQNDFCTEGGVNHKEGKSLLKGKTIIDNLKLLIPEARKVNVPVIYTLNTSLHDRKSDSTSRIRYLMRLMKNYDPNMLVEHTLDGSWGQQVIDEIKPEAKDWIVKKNRPSAFVNTNLDLLLRTNNIKTVLVTGVVTNVCVESTARDALFHDYLVVVLEDCIDGHDKNLVSAALKIIESLYDVASTDDIIKIWKNSTS